uniref:30S ribosomal protein S15 n=1 Tax=Gongylonema pulchrum TaxID=637853 RepID=A0A183DMH8_9BILA
LMYFFELRAPFLTRGYYTSCKGLTYDDKDSKYRLILVESRIHRLARYYKIKRQLPATWKYESSTASALVS